MLTARQLEEWIEYADLEPFGEERADLRAGMVAAVVANVYRDPKARPKPYRPIDFMPLVNEQPKARTPEEQLSVARMMTAMLGGTVR